MPYSVRVLVTAAIDDPSSGVNGVCVYLTGANNNGANTALGGNHECIGEPPGAVSVITKSALVNGTLSAGVRRLPAERNQDRLRRRSRPAARTSTGISGVVGRDGQTFVADIARTTVKP